MSKAKAVGFTITNSIKRGALQLSSGVIVGIRAIGQFGIGLKEGFVPPPQAKRSMAKRRKAA